MNAQLRPQFAGRRLLCNALRFLAIDAVERAGNGHPGMPMGMAEVAEALWRGYLKHDPADPHWVDRDRFVLSNGHGSMLLYALLHLTGYDLPLEELKRFRQLHSKTPGHPEFGVTPGVETTTGPLGQGIANAVGFAIAERLLAAEFNREGFAIVDHYTYVLLGDGRVEGWFTDDTPKRFEGYGWHVLPSVDVPSGPAPPRPVSRTWLPQTVG